MVNVTCDRCGKPMPFELPNGYPRYDIVRMTEIDGPLRALELCDDCKKDFVSWLKNYSREEQSVE